MGFLIALQFLTRLPTPVQRPVKVDEMGRSMRWFPAVGILIGAVVGMADLALASFITPEIRSIAAVALLAAVTGALHLDGLVDACDGLLAFTSPDRRLEIMADSRVGSFGLVGAALILLLKYTAILSIPTDGRLAAFIAMGCLSRWAMVYATVRYPAGRASGLGHAYKTAAGPTELLIATALAIGGAAVAGIAGLEAMLIAWATTVALAHYALSKIPGLTGDVYGAMSELVEVAVAITLPPLARLL
jgi:adenosylcobinamide-GDP ribazoletransferase